MPKPISFSLNRKMLVLVLSVSLISIIVTTSFTFNFADSVLKENILNQLEEQSNQRGALVRNLFYYKINQVVFINKIT